MRIALAAFALAACSAPPKPPPPITNAQPPAHGPAPKIARGGPWGLTTTGLPAISTDGTRIVAAVREPDGQRGLANMTLVIKDRGDREIEKLVVLAIGEADQFLDDADGKNPALDERVSRANTWLSQRAFTPLFALDADPAQIPADRTQVARDGVVVSWADSRLQIRDGTRTLVDTATPTSWLPESFKVGSNVCARFAYLEGAAIDRAWRLAVVTIGYGADSDFCSEPTDQNHVVTW